MKHNCCLQSIQCCFFLFSFLPVVGCAYHSQGAVPASLQFVTVVLAAFRETIPCFEVPSTDYDAPVTCLAVLLRNEQVPPLWTFFCSSPVWSHATSMQCMACAAFGVNDMLVDLHTFSTLR